MTFVRTLGEPSTIFGEKVATVTARFASKQKIGLVQEGVTAKWVPFFVNGESNFAIAFDSQPRGNHWKIGLRQRFDLGVVILSLNRRNHRECDE